MAEKSLPPQPAYASAFEGYKRYADQPVQSWQAANELVARIGGWHAYARESQAARMSSPGPQQPLPKPAVAPPRSPRQ